MRLRWPANSGPSPSGSSTTWRAICSGRTSSDFGEQHIDDLRRFVTTDAWWDTVDALASPTVGTMVLNHPALTETMDEWIDADDMWLARVAIIHQLRFGERTDGERLFRYSLQRAEDPEFFIRKAIGWALREYAKTDPDAIRSFVDRHVEVLTPLSIHEATKHL